MNYQDLQLKVDKLDEAIEKLDKELKRVDAKEDKELFDRFNLIEKQTNERYRIDSNLMVCKIITGTTHASAGTESTHPHYLGRTPNVVLVLPEANATIYKSKASDSTNFYLKSSANATAFTAFILY
jgi:hypothetical protein